MKTLQGHISISRPSCSDGAEYMSVTIEDKLSSCRIVEVRVPLVGMMKALTGLGYVDCEIDWFNGNPIGKIREHKTELVPDVLEYTDRKNTKKIAKILAPFEVDGWKGYTDDLFNGHRKEGDKMRVTFIRHVEVKP